MQSLSRVAPRSHATRRVRFGQRMEPPTGPRRDVEPPTAPKRTGGFSIAAVVIGILVIGWLVFQPSDSQPIAPAPAPSVPTPTPTPQAPPQPPAGDAPTEAPAQPEPQTVTVEADGGGNSAPFNLTGGDYRVTVITGGPCYFAFDLRPVPEGRRTSITRMDEAGEATTYLYGIGAGRYYMSVITGPVPQCPWSVTLDTQ